MRPSVPISNSQWRPPVRRPFYRCRILLVRRKRGPEPVEKHRRKSLDPYAGARRILLLDDERHGASPERRHLLTESGSPVNTEASRSPPTWRFYGYENNGDRPIHWRNNLRYEIKKNIISFRYTHGMKDNLYETYSLGYIRCF